jgi:hypothetical protein
LPLLAGGLGLAGLLGWAPEADGSRGGIGRRLK